MNDEFIDDQPPIGTLTPESRESLRLAMADTPADHPDRARHTPGPWSINRYDIYDKDIVICEPGVRVDFDDVDQDEQEANARLIAISPTMHAYIQERAAGGCSEAKSILDALL